MDEGLPSIEVSEACLRLLRGDTVLEEVLWDQLTGVDIGSNSLWPFDFDLFWILHCRNRTFSIPHGSKGDGDLLSYLQNLSGFDNEAFVAAMGSTSDEVFQLWRSDER